MADNKNQHFVPKCHFKPFSLNNEGKSINVYNHKLDKAIEGASITGQCSRSYFYGQDLELESVFCGFESDYGTILKKIIDNSEKLTPQEIQKLRNFAYLQSYRTEASINSEIQLSKEMDAAAHKGLEEYRNAQSDFISTHEMAVVLAVRLFAETLHTVTDLRTVILENRTTCDFITSDDPAILTNRLNVQRLGGRQFGSASSGVQLILPLTPRHYLISYDEATYNPKIVDDYKVIINRESDVHALNELQLIRCSKNVYFKDAKQKDSVRDRFKKAQKYRPSSWFSLWVGVPSKGKRGSYKKASEEEASSNIPNRMISFTHHPVTPSSWIDALPYRSKIYGYTNGSSVGYVREGQLEAHRFLYVHKEQIRFSPVKLKQAAGFIST